MRRGVRRRRREERKRVDDIAEALAHLRAARGPVGVAKDAARQRETEREEERREVDRVEPVYIWGGLN